MILYGGNVVKKAALWYILIICLRVSAKNGVTQDQVSSRTNTLFDDVDDTQKQLDNEVRERLAQPKTVWVIHIPTRFPVLQLEDLSVTEPTFINTALVRSRREYQLGNPELEDPIISNNTTPCENVEEESSSEEGNVCDSDRTESEKPSEPEKCEEQEEKPGDDWTFDTQHKWHENFPDCAGQSQSPVDLPIAGLIKTRGARKLLFVNYNEIPNNLTLIYNGRNVILTGNWPRDRTPAVYGGAAHSRRYLFHSLVVYWPSEHTIATLHYPMETQALHVSAEYGSFEEAVANSPKDPLAFLGVVNIYKFDSETQAGLRTIINSAQKCKKWSVSMKPMPLSVFSPPFKEYVCYQGSLPIPPCTESVLWMIRRRSLTVNRESSLAFHSMLLGDDPPQKVFIRVAQALNDRHIYFFR
ncbi:carbonic anhydrase 6-like [Pectinophora gossypiella]|uniref:carbonic anhydrase 6-like n=1 Tax=Pectinophora gossypiella TaxID=13191 RepID=UPI00214E4DCC|nr:carbonic anhydrase 6-like [Pectinophora gossypiella]